ncbi:MAG: hypothetical protein ACJ746_28815 [Bryobacteraceae bacterium]
MAKKSNESFLHGVASFTGHLAGSVEGAIEAAVEVGHHLSGPKVEPLHEDVHFEPSDINHRRVVIGGACLLGGMWLTIGLLFFFFVYLKNYRAEVSPPPLPVTLSRATLPPEPRLQNAPEQDLRSFRAAEDWKLAHYYWVDKTKGQVAIPIDQAIQIIAQRGIPPEKTPPNPTLTPPEGGTRLTGFEGKVKPEPR